MITEGPRGCAQRSRLHHEQASASQTREMSAARPTHTPASRAPDAVRRTDTVELSSTSPVRAQKVAQARQRIADGYYERPDVRQALGRLLLEQLEAGR
jgi:anti-sigma28 factor (negative regulator of flagellin synthesis)